MIQRQYQQLGSLFLASRKNAILADEMGLGKTNQAICAIDLLSLSRPINRTLIVTPAIVRPQWEAQLNHWLIAHNPYPIQQVETTDAKVTGKTIIVSYALVNEKRIFDQLMRILWDIHIDDEFHYMKNVDAKRTTNVLGKDGLVTRCKRNWFLSGTPVTAKPADLFPILVTIARKRLRPFTDWYKYTKRFCNGHKNEYGQWEYFGADHLEQLAEIISGVMLRRLVKDCEPDLDKPLWDVVKLQMPKGTQEQYENECDEIDHDYESSQQRIILSNLKGETLSEHLKLVQSSNKKLVVFFHHKAIGRYLRSKQSIKTFMVTGGMSTKKKHSAVEEFVKCKDAVFFAQSQAAGTGLDGLQFGSSVGYFAEMPWNPDLRDQNIMRLLRPGQKEKVKAIVPVVQDTVDDKIYYKWFVKEKIINTIVRSKENVRETFSSTDCFSSCN